VFGLRCYSTNLLFKLIWIKVWWCEVCYVCEKERLLSFGVEPNLRDLLSRVTHLTTKAHLFNITHSLFTITTLFYKVTLNINDYVTINNKSLIVGFHSYRFGRIHPLLSLRWYYFIPQTFIEAFCSILFTSEKCSLSLLLILFKCLSFYWFVAIAGVRSSVL
jgi:hypothetical protein